MTLLEIKDAIYNQIDELDKDEQVDVIVLNAIQKAVYDLSKIDKRLSQAYCPVIMGRAELPDDIIEVIEVTPALIEKEKRVGNSILSKRNITFEVLYNYTREKLINDSDEPELSQDLHYSIVLYACSAYFKHRKKPDISNMYLGEYEQSKNDFLANVMNDQFAKGGVEEVICSYGY